LIQNCENPKKNDSKSTFKKNMFFNTLFYQFFVVLASENEAKIASFPCFFENVDFMKIIDFP